MKNTNAFEKIAFIIIIAVALIINLLFKINSSAISLQITIYIVFGLIVFFFSRALYPSYVFITLLFENGIQANYIGANSNYILSLTFLIAIFSILFYKMRINPIFHGVSLYLTIFFLYYLVVSYVMIDSTSRLDYFQVHLKTIISALIIAFLMFNKQSFLFFWKFFYCSFRSISIIYFCFILFGI